MNKLFLLGDSTCAIKDREARPETGWGEKFFPYIKNDWSLLNYAKNGRSTRSALKEGIITSALFEAGEGDSVIVEYGHNDEKTDDRGTDAFTSYIADLKYIASAFISKGCKVYFVTPVPRHKFDGHRAKDTHKDYVAAVKIAGHQLSIPVLDITLPLMMDLSLLGEEESRRYYMHFGADLYENFPEGKTDDTHLRPEGAEWVAKEIADGMKKLGAEFMREEE